MQLNQLQQLITVCETGSMNAAAESCYVSQSAISQNIRNLEQELDIRIFFRSPGRKMRLTEEGKILLKYAEKMFSVEKQLRQELDRKKENRTIKIYASGGLLIPILVENLIKGQAEAFRISTSISDRKTAIKQFFDERGDLLLEHGYIDEPEVLANAKLSFFERNEKKQTEFCNHHNLDKALFYVVHLMLCVPPDSPYACCKSISLEQLKKIPIVRTKYMVGFNNWLDLFILQNKIELNTVMDLDADSFQRIQFGYACNYLMPSTCIYNNPRYMTDCVLIPIDSPDASYDLYLYYRKDDDTMRELIKKTLIDFDWENYIRTF